MAMTSKRSMPVKSFSATAVTGTLVIVNMYVSTVRPSEIEIGMPVSIRPNSSRKMMIGVGTLMPSANAASGSTIIATGSNDQKRKPRVIARCGTAASDGCNSSSALSTPSTYA